MTNPVVLLEGAGAAWQDVVTDLRQARSQLQQMDQSIARLDDLGGNAQGQISGIPQVPDDATTVVARVDGVTNPDTTQRA